MKKVEIIKNCPSCDSLLERVKGQIFCRNNECESKSIKKIIHFAKTLKIKGLGEKTIEKLNLEKISDIYKLSKEESINCIGEKLGLKLFLEIERSKKQKMEVLLSSFGINLIGISAAKKISIKTINLEEIDEYLCKMAGLGKKASLNLCTWLKEYEFLWKSLPIEIVDEVNSNTNISKDIIVCVTGKINNHTRNTAEALLENNGITCVSGISTKVNYLICNDENSQSSKAIKARKYGITIMSFEKFLRMENIVNE